MKKLSKLLILTVLIFSFCSVTTFAYQIRGYRNVRIEWFGHSSFGISDEDETKIVTDPYCEGLGYDFPEVSTSILTVSHQHFDHNSVEALQKYSHLIKYLGKFRYDSVQVKGIPSYHDEELGELRGKNIIYTYRINGVKICHLGDLGHLLTEEEITAIGKVDVLMIPVGGLYTIDAQNAAKVVEQIDPKIVIPMHYKTEVLIEEFGPIDGVDKFISEMKDWKVEESDALELNKEELDKSEDKTIVVLSYK